MKAIKLIFKAIDALCKRLIKAVFRFMQRQGLGRITGRRWSGWSHARRPLRPSIAARPFYFISLPHQEAS